MITVKLNKHSLQDYINTKSKKELINYINTYDTKYQGHNGYEIKCF
jgi:hypothetical protein